MTEDDAKEIVADCLDAIGTAQRTCDEQIDANSFLKLMQPKYDATKRVLTHLLMGCGNFSVAMTAERQKILLV